MLRFPLSSFKLFQYLKCDNKPHDLDTHTQLLCLKLKQCPQIWPISQVTPTLRLKHDCHEHYKTTFLRLSPLTGEMQLPIFSPYILQAFCLFSQQFSWSFLKGTPFPPLSTLWAVRILHSSYLISLWFTRLLTFKSRYHLSPEVTKWPIWGVQKLMN